ncbi:hypothetical protein A2U01_0091454, partial [Trifolium medium]|nr:hypothetical protein [Trifolium medium]
DDIAKVSPLKQRKDSSDSEEDLPASEDKITAEGKGKEQMVSAAATPKRKRADKEKMEKIMEGKKKSTKKPRTQKKRAPKV